MPISPKKIENRVYHILAIAVAFFIVGLFFFFHTGPASAPSARPPAGLGTGVAVQSGQSPSSGSGQSSNPTFASYPAPSTFATFTYAESGVSGSSALPIAAKCGSTYVTLLIFPVSVDYRNNVTSAAYNEALPCTAGDSVGLSITPQDMGAAPFGTYYFIVADEGTSGTWYNPR